MSSITKLAAALIRPAPAPPETGNALVPVGPTVTDLEANILRHHADYTNGVCKAASAAVETGGLLLELKARIRSEYGHGFWETYVRNGFHSPPARRRTT